MSAQVEPVETVLHGPLRDQAELHGTLALIRALGLELIEVRKLPGATAPPSDGQWGPSSDSSRARRTAPRRSSTASLR